jgi:SAM-dependent methyltransferase
VRLSDYVTLWRLYRDRLLSEEHYRQAQAFQARQLIGYLGGHGIRMEGCLVLDLGSGIGGYSSEFARQGASVISVDLVVLGRLSAPRVGRVQADALNIPARNEAVDVVFCASLIEHVPDPAAILCEMERVLKPGGACYVSFPPYFSPLGGHQFSPLHYLGQDLAIKLKGHNATLPEWVRELYGIEPGSRPFSASFQTWGLYRMTLRKFRHELVKTHLRCINISTRYMPVSFVRWPLVGEFLTWHAQYLLRKPS